ncbi:MAG: copper transporter [Capsulimonadaceae bacterium]
MLNISYHIVTICAVFIALAVGILIGERIEPAQEKQQERSLAVLQKQVDGAVQEGREAKRRLTHVEAAVDGLRLQTVAGMLDGKNVEVIDCGNYSQAKDSVEDAIRDAGGKVTAVVSVTDRFLDLTSSDRVDLLSKLSPNASPPAGTDVPTDSLLAPLATVLCSGTDTVTNVATDSTTDTNTEADPASTALLSVYKDTRCITVAGDVSQPCRLFVIIGGHSDDGTPEVSAAQDIEGAVGRALPAAGADVSVVGCEPIDTVTSSIPIFQKCQIATVDCVDTPLGKLDLPFALRGGADKADYGLKTTATRELPASIEEQSHP